MNYRAELKGYCFDRALKFNADNSKNMPIDSVLELADRLAEYFYIPEKDIDSHLQTLMPLIVRSNDLEKIDNLILQLQQIRAEMAAGIIKPEVN